MVPTWTSQVPPKSIFTLDSRALGQKQHSGDNYTRNRHRTTRINLSTCPLKRLAKRSSRPAEGVDAAGCCILCRSWRIDPAWGKCCDVMLSTKYTVTRLSRPWPSSRTLCFESDLSGAFRGEFNAANFGRGRYWAGQRFAVAALTHVRDRIMRELCRIYDLLPA